MCPVHDELIDASNGMRTNLRRIVLEKLQELWNQKVQRPVKNLRVEHIGRVFADLLQGAKGSLRNIVILGVQHVTKSR